MEQDEYVNKSYRILVVDDEETIIRLYTRILEGSGHTVGVAKSGQEAIAQVQENKFDLVFLDLKLPDDEGIEILKKIKDKLEWAPVIIATAHPSLKSSIDAIKTGGVYEYMIKPFKGPDLLVAIKRVMEKAELTIENKRLLRKLESSNQALLERVEELEEIAKRAFEYEAQISELSKEVEELKK